MLKVRNIKKSDKARVKEIVKDIWEGDDYMPLVFDSWIKEKEGLFVGAVDEKGKLVGFEKLTMLSSQDVWIEGLRKDMKSGVKGVGTFLTEYIFKELMKNKDIKTIRFATYIYNNESIALFTKMGFNLLEIRDYKFLNIPKLKYVPKYKNNRAEVLTDLRSVIKFIKNSKWLKNNNTGLCHSWVAKPFSEELIKGYVDSGNCIGITINGYIQALTLLNVREKSDIFIVFFEAENEMYASELLRKIKQKCYSENRFHISTVLSQKDNKLHDYFAKRRFRSWETEGDFRLFDFPVSNLKSYKFRNTKF